MPYLTLGGVPIARFARPLHRLPAEIRCIEIVFPGDAHQGEQSIDRMSFPV
jgi:hypothetical protein